MALLKIICCKKGHRHEVYSVQEPINEPWDCPDELQISRTTFTKEKDLIEYGHSNKPHNTPKEKREMETNHLHNDSRPTVVIINQIIYDLVPSEWTKETLLEAEPIKRPHVRILNSIPERTKLQQEAKNKDEKYLHELYVQIPKASTPASKSKHRIEKGESNHEIEIKKLLGLKERAQKEGNSQELRRIRIALRKLDYKRYTNKENANG